MKKLIKWIFYIFVGFMVLGYFASKNGPSSSTKSSGNAEAQETTPKQEVFNTTARQLFKAYDENEVATDEQMKGKLVAVKGVVQSIDKDFTDSIIISLKTDNEFMPARMQVEDSGKDKAMALKKGQQITVICKRMSRVVGSPSGRDCEFAQ